LDVVVRHAVLGAGGIGLLVAGALARAGGEVVLLLRAETLARYDGRISVESAVLGDFDVAVPGAAELDREVDALWVTTKATQLERAIELAPPERVGGATVVPLLNGVDHVAFLRARYPRVVAGAIRVESARLEPGRVRQSSPFVQLDLAGAEPLVAALTEAGLDCRLRDDELTLLWEKLAFLAPVALATTAFDGTLGAVRDEPLLHGCRNEALAVAAAEGARVDGDALAALHGRIPDSMGSSMQRDVAAGNPPELDAIAGPIRRGGARHGIPVPCTDELVELVEARL
jgi:2-dehydropantoate 2-reductase